MISPWLRYVFNNVTSSPVPINWFWSNELNFPLPRGKEPWQADDMCFRATDHHHSLWQSPCSTKYLSYDIEGLRGRDQAYVLVYFRNFSSFSESTEIRHANSFCVKNDFHERVWRLVSPLVEKKYRQTFLTQKESAWLISVDSEQLEKLQQNRYIRLPSTEPFNY